MRKVFLLADDDLDDIELFCEALAMVDASILCLCATNGEEALDTLRDNERPNLIFLDINMPRMNGWEFLERVKKMEEFRNIPVLVYSTSKHPKDINTALDLGAICFFSKPESFSELKRILEVVVANVDNDLLAAVSQFTNIKSEKVFACADDE